MSQDLISFTQSIYQGTDDLMTYLMKYIDQNVELYNLLKAIPHYNVSVHSAHNNEITYRLSDLNKESIEEIINCIHDKRVSLYGNVKHIICTTESDSSLLVSMVNE